MCCIFFLYFRKLGRVSRSCKVRATGGPNMGVIRNHRGHPSLVSPMPLTLIATVELSDSISCLKAHDVYTENITITVVIIYIKYLYLFSFKITIYKLHTKCFDIANFTPLRGYVRRFTAS
jgi:hypothetical protein